MKSALAALAAIPCMALALSAQSPQPPPSPAAKQTQSEEGPSARITLDVTRVNMLFTVSDKKGRFVTDLARDDFEVVETKKPQNILEFTAESNLPLRIGILIDTSNSIRDRFRFQQEAATDFVNAVIRQGQDKGM